MNVYLIGNFPFPSEAISIRCRILELLDAGEEFGL